MNVLAKEEPRGWPLRRPITSSEWAQVMKLMALRRVPEGRSVDRIVLTKYLQDDIKATFESGRLYLEPSMYPPAYGPNIIQHLIRDGILREGHVGYDPQRPYLPVFHIFRTDTTSEYLSLVPKHIAAVLDYFPVTNELDLLASLLPPENDDLPVIERRPEINPFTGELGF